MRSFRNVFNTRTKMRRERVLHKLCMRAAKGDKVAYVMVVADQLHLPEHQHLYPEGRKARKKFIRQNFEPVQRWVRRILGLSRKELADSTVPEIFGR